MPGASDTLGRGCFADETFLSQVFGGHHEAYYASADRYYRDGTWVHRVLFFRIIARLETYPSEIAGDYAVINHNRGNGDVVTVVWWASLTARPGSPSQLVSVFERHVLISITHSHLNLGEPVTGLRFDDVDKLEVRNESGNHFAPFDQDLLPPASIGNLSAFEAGYRQGLGPRGKGTKFFQFEAGGVHACEKGGISVPYDGETYTWETPFPGCSAPAK
jgi:hypothetical protein